MRGGGGTGRRKDGRQGDGGGGDEGGGGEDAEVRVIVLKDVTLIDTNLSVNQVLRIDLLTDFFQFRCR